MSLARLKTQHAAEAAGIAAQVGVRSARVGRALHVVLDRPRQLNALDHDVVSILRSTLEDAADDPRVHVVTLTGAGSRGLCAGGDLVYLHGAVTADDGSALRFWRDLYELVDVVASSPVPVVAVQDGIVLGGGLGVSSRAQLRVVTERSVVGMPETRIGFFPDTGGLHLLAHLPGEVGTWLALCAQTLGAADAISIGLADHFVWSDDVRRLLDRLTMEPVGEVLAAVADAPPPGRDWAPQEWIDECFAGDDPGLILGRLLEHRDRDAREAGEVMASRSPAAVAVTLRGLRAARTMDLTADVAFELRLAQAFHRHPDFREGIRARLLDKDRSPTWAPWSNRDLDDYWPLSV